MIQTKPPQTIKFYRKSFYDFCQFKSILKIKTIVCFEWKVESGFQWMLSLLNKNFVGDHIDSGLDNETQCIPVITLVIKLSVYLRYGQNQLNTIAVAVLVIQTNWWL